MLPVQPSFHGVRCQWECEQLPAVNDTLHKLWVFPQLSCLSWALPNSHTPEQLLTNHL